MLLSRKLMTTIAISTLAVGALAGCGTRTGSTGSAAGSQQQSQLGHLVADVTGSLQKVASSTDKVTSVTFTMTGTSAGTKVSGEGAMAFQPLKAEINVDGGTQGATTLRVVDNVIYVKVPDSQRAQMQGKTWLKLDVSGNSPFGDVSRQMQDVNPIEQVKTLLASGSATAVGQETVNGVPTVHYKATTSVDTVLKQAKPEYRSMLKGVYDKAGVKEITTEIWIDDQYRPHRVHVLAGTMSDMTVDYLQYNQPVTVSAPAAKDTLDLSDILKGLGG